MRTTRRSKPRSAIRGLFVVGALGALFLATLATLATLAAPRARANECGPALPEVLHLPDGFQPEGITRGHGSLMYVAGFATGGIYIVDAQTGTGHFLVPPQTNGRQSIGIKRDGDRLFVAGGSTGHGYVYDARTGAPLADYVLADPATGATFINDLLVTDTAVYFTDSFRSVLYVAPFHHHDLPSQSAVKAVTLGGDYKSIDGQFNGNGIVLSPDGDDDELIVVGSAVGVLYRVDPRTGIAKAIDLGGGSVVNGDGLVIDGHTLYVVENFSNQVAVVKLQKQARKGEIVRTLTNPNLDVPATAVLFEDALYVTNARFSTTSTPTTPYAVVRVPVR